MSRSWICCALFISGISSCQPKSLSHSTRVETQAQKPTLQEIPLISEETQQIESGPIISVGREISIERELRKVEKIRGLTAKEKVGAREVKTHQLLAHVRRIVERDVPERVLIAQEKAMISLGFAPFGFDLKNAMLTLLDDQLAGLYDPKYGLMLLRDNLGQRLRQATLQHELVHALQDQHYDLSPLNDYSSASGDKRTAFSALAEGDATSVMFDLLLQPKGQTALDLSEEEIFDSFRSGSDSSAKEIPTLLRRSAIAPYQYGLQFVHALRRRGGWPEVNRAFLRQPSSTEQILHLKKYDDNEVPLSLQPLIPTNQGWSLIDHDTQGELGILLFLEEALSKEKSATAASGWGADLLSVWSQKEDLNPSAQPSKTTLSSQPDPEAIAELILWQIRMDSERDAQELFAALQPQNQTGIGLGGGVCFEQSGKRVLFIQRERENILLRVAPAQIGSRPSSCSERTLKDIHVAPRGDSRSAGIQ